MKNIGYVKEKIINTRRNELFEHIDWCIFFLGKLPKRNKYST